jgi:hypothetical protein
MVLTLKVELTLRRPGMLISREEIENTRRRYICFTHTINIIKNKSGGYKK